jgi:hypothetical protein
VNDDEVAGKRVPFRNSFSRMTAVTFTLVESMAAEGGWRLSHHGLVPEAPAPLISGARRVPLGLSGVGSS